MGGLKGMNKGRGKGKAEGGEKGTVEGKYGRGKSQPEGRGKGKSEGGRGKGKSEGREKGKSEGKGNGKDKGPAPQRGPPPAPQRGPRPLKTQIDALQGLWEEVGRSKKRWLIKSYNATEVVSGGQMGRKFTVREGANGSVEWGTNGKYFLDRRFGVSMDTAVWRLGSPDGAEAFSWRCVEGSPLAGDEAGPSAGPAPVGRYIGPSSNSPGERRIDPGDGGAYTWQELRARYAGEYTKRESEAYWEACKVVKPPSEVQVERRIDPDDGNIYSWEEIASHYGSEFSQQEIRDYWDHCKVVSWTMPERRIDPADGIPYSWREMKAFYTNEYTLSATVSYWDACKVEEGYGPAPRS